MAFMRQYGMLEGDPGPRPVPKRKQAAAGPKAKASRKRVVRAKRAARGRQGAPKAPGKKSRAGGLAGSILSGLGKFGVGALKDVPGLGGGLRAFEGAAPGRAFGGARRTMNVANVKALRRGIRRLEGFKNLVKRVDKLLPPSARMGGGGARRSARGHKAGCKCVACR